MNVSMKVPSLQEVRAGQFIDANLKDGVLTVRMPKQVEFQAREINVNAGRP